MKNRIGASVPRLLAGLGFVLVLVVWAGVGAARADGPAPPAATDSRYLRGQLLVASPRIGDPRFARTVIYMVEHDKDGALGLVVNRVYGKGPLNKFLEGFDIDSGGVDGEISLHYGGPVQPGAGFVLHTADYRGPGTQVVDSRFALTTEMSVLRAIAEGKGPRRAIFMLGYAGWGPGQLEGEIARGDWLNAPADETLVFDEDVGSKWDRATSKAGIDL